MCTHVAFRMVCDILHVWINVAVLYTSCHDYCSYVCRVTRQSRSDGKR